MNRLSGKILARIIVQLDDEDSLIALAAVSQRLRKSVPAQRMHWCRLYRRRFPDYDDNELRWLRVYALERSTDEPNTDEKGDILNVAKQQQPELRLNWFG